MSLSAVIRPFEEKDIDSVKKLTDKEIGADYYSKKELLDIYQRSNKNGIGCSFVLEDKKEICGIRFTFPPGQWKSGKGQGLSEDLWDFPKTETAYFQSLFIKASMQKKGFGKKMSLASLKALRDLEAKGVVCHSWKESPQNSSYKYLTSLGFKSLAKHPHYWKEVDYQCPRCDRPCLCTAEEMYLVL